MIKKLNIRASLRNFSCWLFLFMSLFGFISVLAQPKSNLEIFLIQIDSVGMQIQNSIKDQNAEIKISFLSSPEYSILENRLTSYFIKSGFKISNNSNSDEVLEFIITEASVKYSDAFRDGLFGEFLVERNIYLKGNFIISGKNITTDFSYNFADTVGYERLKEIENRAYHFTQNSHPSEPFFSSLIEPVIAIGAAATAVILFFTIRTK